MALFSRKTQSQGSRSGNELLVLSQSIQTRDQAPISEAKTVVDEFVNGVQIESGTTGNDDARAWIRQQIMFMIAMIPAPQWFEMFDRWGLPERIQLKAEWVELVRRHAEFGPEHFVAWWWNIQRSLFEPTVANQLNQMKASLIDVVTMVMQSEAGDFSTHFPNWSLVSD